MARFIGVAGLALACATFLGCKDDQACERGRLDLRRTWDSMRKEAAKYKGKAAEEKAESQIRAWTLVESQLDLLESAFATTQITWQSAAKKLGELQRASADLAAANPGLQAFRAGVDAAAQAQEAFQGKCR